MEVDKGLLLGRFGGGGGGGGSGGGNGGVVVWLWRHRDLQTHVYIRAL